MIYTHFILISLPLFILMLVDAVTQLYLIELVVFLFLQEVLVLLLDDEVLQRLRRLW